MPCSMDSGERSVPLYGNCATPSGRRCLTPFCTRGNFPRPPRRIKYMRYARIWTLAAVALVVAMPLHAQRGAIDLTVEMLDRWLNGTKTEKTEMGNVNAQLREQDEKLRKFRECKTAWEIAGEASGS